MPCDPTPYPPPPPPTRGSCCPMDSQSSSDNGAFADQLRQVSAFLEAIVADRALLAGLPAGDRKRFLDAVAAVYHPDVKARRQLVKAAKRQRKASKVRDEE